jgi:Uma2 family endonuclease
LNLPESDWMRQELHHGELFEMPPARHGHKNIQRRLTRLLETAAGATWLAAEDIGFRPFAGPEYWIGDVVSTQLTRWDAIPDDGIMSFVPELVIEVLSPSNRPGKMRDRKNVYLENGGHEFWLVDPKKREVVVSTSDGHSTTFKSGEQIPLFFNSSATIAVDAIFE